MASKKTKHKQTPSIPFLLLIRQLEQCSYSWYILFVRNIWGYDAHTRIVWIDTCMWNSSDLDFTNKYLSCPPPWLLVKNVFLSSEISLSSNHVTGKGKGALQSTSLLFFISIWRSVETCYGHSNGVCARSMHRNNLFSILCKKLQLFSSENTTQMRK